MTSEHATASPAESMLVVMVTQPSKRADAILGAFAERGIEVRALILDQGDLSAPAMLTRTRQVWRRSGSAETIRRLARRIRRAVLSRKSRGTDEARYASQVADVFPVADVNDDAAHRVLTELDPDLIVLGSSRILKPHVIEIPRRGVLNAHPGVLPDYRGVDVVAWALYNGDPLGVSVHFVDAGIDTGPIVAQRRYEPASGDTLWQLERKADAIAGDLMADVVGRLAAGETVEQIEQKPAVGRLFSRMSPGRRRQLEQSLRARWAAEWAPRE